MPAIISDDTLGAEKWTKNNLEFFLTPFMNFHVLCSICSCCPGFTRDKGQYFSKPSPARKGDYIEWIAEVDLLVGLSACPFGDVSAPCGTPLDQIEGFPLLVEIFDVKTELLEEWDYMNSQLNKRK